MPIRESFEPMVALPRGLFVLATPHPYVKAGAPYNGVSPWMLREGVVNSLVAAQKELQKIHPGWKFKLTDAYRPNRVQEFVVKEAFASEAKKACLDVRHLSNEQSTELWTRVHRLWARPSNDPASPPPHSTGAAFDITFADPRGREINMGSPIDENSPRSNPDHFAVLNPKIHARRELLNQLLVEQSCRRDKDEWWHFVSKEQYYAYHEKLNGNVRAASIYGRADLLPGLTRA